MTEPRRPLLLLTAFLFHVPGLWALARRAPPAGILVLNLAALGLTVLGMAAAAVLLPASNPMGPVLVWAVGHVLWGLELARRVDRELV